MCRGEGWVSQAVDLALSQVALGTLRQDGDR